MREHTIPTRSNKKKKRRDGVAGNTNKQSSRLTIDRSLAYFIGFVKYIIANSYELFQIHDKINHDEDVFGRPILTAVVIVKAKNRPGDGFFKCAESLKKYSGSTDEQNKLDFWAKVLSEVYTFYR